LTRAELLPPPSRPTLAVANLAVNITVLQTNLQFSVTSDANGQFAVPGLLPLSLVEIRAQTSAAGKFYYGLAQFILDRNRNVNIAMLTDVDVLSGVPPFTFASGTIQSAQTSLALQTGQAAEKTFSESSVAPTATDVAPPRIGPGPLTVPKGTKKVTLTYNVSTAEYPFYVLNQSIYNDVLVPSAAPGSSTIGSRVAPSIATAPERKASWICCAA
jgi:hypothetical protein